MARPFVAKKIEKERPDSTPNRCSGGGSDGSEKSVDLPSKPKTTAIVNRADEVRTEIKMLAKKMAKDGQNLMELLWEVKDQGYYTDYGFKTWEDYVQSEVGIKPRNAYMLKRVWEAFHIKGGLPASEVRQIPYTKGDIVASEVTPDNAKEWAAKAKNTRGDDLRKTVRNRREERKETADPDEKEVPQEKFKRFMVYLSPKQTETVNLALAAAAKKAESDKENHQLAQICGEWLSLYGARGVTDADVLANLFHRLGDRHGYEVFAFPKKIKSEQKQALLSNILDNVEELFGVELEIVDGDEEKEGQGET
ncbi:MAG: hypothetical protein ABIH23_08810 [bacterium]